MVLKHLCLLFILGVVAHVVSSGQCIGNYYYLESGVSGIQRLSVSSEYGLSGLTQYGVIPGTAGATYGIAASGDLLCWLTMDSTKVFNCQNMTTSEFANATLPTISGLSTTTQLRIDMWESFACVNKTALGFGRIVCFGFTLNFSAQSISFGSTFTTPSGGGSSDLDYVSEFTISRETFYGVAAPSSAIIMSSASFSTAYRAPWLNRTSSPFTTIESTATDVTSPDGIAQVGAYAYEQQNLNMAKLSLNGTFASSTTSIIMPGLYLSADYPKLLGTGPDCTWLYVVNQLLSADMLSTNVNLTSVHVTNGTKTLIKNWPSGGRHDAVAWGFPTPIFIPLPPSPPVEPPPMSPPVAPPIAPPVTPPIDPPVEPPVSPPVDPPVNPPVDPPVEPPVTIPEVPPPVSKPCPSPKPTPASSFYCNDTTGAWVSNGTIETTTVTVSSPVIIEGNLTVSGPITFSGGTSTITVRGCVRGLQSVTVQLTQEEYNELVKTGKLDKLLITSSCDTSGLGNIPVSVTFAGKHKSCEKVTAKSVAESNTLASSFVLDKSACNRWWIILVSVIGGVILLCAIVTAVWTLHPKLNRHRKTTRTRTRSVM